MTLMGYRVLCSSSAFLFGGSSEEEGTGCPRQTNACCFERMLFVSSRSEFFSVHIFRPAFYHSKHTAYKLEFDGVKHTSERLTLRSFSRVI